VRINFEDFVFRLFLRVLFEFEQREREREKERETLPKNSPFLGELFKRCSTGRKMNSGMMRP